MTEDDGSARVSSSESNPSNDASQTRQRKKRKWDQPADSLASAGATVTNILPTANLGFVVTLPLPGVVLPVSGVNPVAASGSTIAPFFQALSMCQQATLVPKVNHPKLQDDLIIAREIVINDAETPIRYKLTKRQTQEEIQRCTGAVVITRGKYHPPDAPPDGEKPLYLHISAGSHLKETAQQILAVDGAAAMVEGMLKQSPNSLTGSRISPTVNSLKPLSSCVYLGFESDPSLNVAARIRGPNDQYINHIMNETGATVVLRGHGSENIESQTGEEAQQPLHLFLSGSTHKSLEDAQRLAENLLDTISAEFGASRGSLQVHGAMPPAQQLLAGVQGIENEQTTNAGLTSPTLSMTPCPVSTSALPPATAVYYRGPVLQPVGLLNGGQFQTHTASYPWPVSSGGTIYDAYAGIYPQVTPLQQVGFALRQSTSSAIFKASSTVSVAMTSSASSASSGFGKEKEKQPPQKQKFQELPVGLEGVAITDQDSESLRARDSANDRGVRNTSTMPALVKLVHSSTMEKMPPPPPKSPKSTPLPMPPPKSMSSVTSRTRFSVTPNAMPPPPPKFTYSTPPLKLNDGSIAQNKSKGVPVPDTLIKLMEYGEDDDDDGDDSDLDETPRKLLNDKCGAVSTHKPFWAV